MNNFNALYIFGNKMRNKIEDNIPDVRMAFIGSHGTYQFLDAAALRPYVPGADFVKPELMVIDKKYAEG